MHLYTASVSSRRGRPAITLPKRSGRPVVALPHHGPIAATCRCGGERTAAELAVPGRDCARCLPPVASR